MKYSIHMLKDGHANQFMRYDFAMAHGGVNLADYMEVWSGNYETPGTVTETLEAIWIMLNIAHPVGYRARSLSVSDLVTLEGAGTYFVDSFGFKKIN